MIFGVMTSSSSGPRLYGATAFQDSDRDRHRVCRSDNPCALGAEQKVSTSVRMSCASASNAATRGTIVVWTVSRMISDPVGNVVVPSGPSLELSQETPNEAAPTVSNAIF